MSRPIAETPILYGKDAINFRKAMIEAEKRKMTPEKRANIKANYDLINSIKKGNFG